ncbi:hypothetical protein MMC22_008939 [Lobaria immixta]|nr:hypothetical protein [Lobaria immixta]
MNIHTIIHGASNQTAEQLWDKAFQKLSENDRGTIDPQHTEKLDILQDVLEAVEKKKQLCLRKRWKYKKSNGEVIILRDLLEKVMVWVNKFKEVVDVAIQYDPVHAALPWAAVRFLLQLGIDENQTFGSMLEGVEYVSNLISRYAVFELLYLQQKPAVSAGVKDQLTVSLVSLYTAILQYLCQASRYYRKGTTTRFLGATIQLSTVNGYLDKVSKEEKRVDDCAQLVIAERRNILEKVVQDVQQTLNRLDIEQQRMYYEAQITQQHVETLVTLRQNIFDGFDDISKNLELLISERQNTKRVTNNLEIILSGLREPISRSATQISELHDSLKQSERQDVFKWMSQIPYPTHHKTMGKDLLSESGLWLLQKLEFTQWRKSSSSSILWLHGIPGSGKSKLTYTVIELFKNESCTIRTTAPIAYFYCTRNVTEPQRANPDEIMRSILKQLSCSKSDVPIKEPIVNAYRKRKEEAYLHGCDLEKLTVDECVQLTLALLENDPAVIIIDALDECDPARRHEILIAFDTIIHRSANLVKVFVSSRDDNDIVCRLTNSPNVYIRATDNSEDIRRFVYIEVDRSLEDRKLLSGDISARMKSRIITTLIEGAQGMFRWVTLQIENLCDFERIKHEDDIKQELGRLPMTLKGSYDVIFKRIQDSGPRSRSVADSVMRWLLSAQCPLKSSDFITAVSVDAQGQHSVLLVSHLLHMCCNLVVLDTDLDLFRFAHLSVREYIECREEYKDFKNHAHAMARCLDTFINMPVSAVGKGEFFTRYSTIYWPIHCQYLERTRLPESLNAKVHQFLLPGQDEAPFTKWALSAGKIDASMSWTDSLKKMVHEAWSSPPTVLFVACYLGLSSILDLLATFAGVDWNQRNMNGHTALHIGVLRDDKAVVRLLLKKKVDLEIVDKDLATALSLAAINQLEEIVDLLLDKGASPDSRDWNGRTALHRLSVTGLTAGSHAIVNLLLVKGASLSLKDKKEMTPLSLAIINQEVEMVRFLLEKGADANLMRHPLGRTMLHQAAEQKKSAVVEALLENKAEVIAGDAKGRTALLLATERWFCGLVKVVLDHGADIEAQATDELKSWHISILNGFIGIMEVLLEKGADVNSQGNSGKPALHFVAQEGYKKSVELLLKAGADVDIPDVNGWTALCLAAFGGHEKSVELLLKAGADVDKADWDGRTALLLAASRGHEKVASRGHEKSVELLLKAGAEVDKAGKDGRTALHLAAERGDEKSVELLLKAGAELNKVSVNGQTALIEAAGGGRGASVDLLLKADADVNVADSDGQTALLLAADRGHKKSVELLLKASAEVDKAGKHGRTALHLAAERGDEKSVELLLKAGADADKADSDGRTALLIAAEGGHEKSLELLLEAGADVNRANKHGLSALHLAAKKGQKKSVELLLEAGADVDKAGKHGQTALHRAAKKGDQNSVELLLKAGADVNKATDYGRTALHLAVHDGHEKSVELLLEARADVNKETDYGRTALHLAADGGHEKSVELLLTADADKADSDGQTALHLAADGGHEKSVELLLEARADADKADSGGPTALHLAANGGHEKSVELLLTAGADVNVAGWDEWTALHLAAHGGHEKSVELLLKAGADADKADSDGQTALHQAAEKGDESSVKSLLKAGADVNAAD